MTSCANNQNLSGLFAHLSDRGRGVCLRKINYSVAFREHGGQIVSDINLGGNFKLRIGRRARDEGFDPYGLWRR